MSTITREDFDQLVATGAVRIAPATSARSIPDTIRETVATLMAAVRYGVTMADTARDLGGAFLADHTHECLSAGAYSLALEGAYEWPFEVHPAYSGKGIGPTDGVTLSVPNGWRMDLYPEDVHPTY